MSTNLTMAELSLQRGDTDRARQFLEKRISQGASDFKTLNLYGVALSQNRIFDNGATIFRRLLAGTLTPGERARASFNLALVLFYQDLSVEGDLSISHSMHSRPGTILPVQRPQPFGRSVEIWDSMLRRRHKQQDIIHTYLAFVCYQLGYLEHALGHIAAALNHNEGFYITHFVLSRVFTDLFLLSAEGNNFSLTQQTLSFFEIEKYELAYEEKGERFVVNRDTLLDIALQSLLDARELSPLTASIYLGMSDVYLYAGLIEDAFEALAHAEALTPNSLTVLEQGLRLHECVRSGPANIRNLLNRIKLAKRRDPIEVYQIVPSYYML